VLKIVCVAFYCENGTMFFGVRENGHVRIKKMLPIFKINTVFQNQLWEKYSDSILSVEI
jgi:hypothetical protein